ncbi:methyl-accepting chemotaxis protein [Nitratidesulfovibrio vulgaris]|jgi:methyl-accepting chemotaxis protein|uniref:Methyl-accepting chemotaxis sensory transducer n=1 Tax=Nitratidesulfovibrio vulgaris (strain DP4) TaxID=391774 RepID=A0A0H3A4V8_NITV4|nr:methyl-accepting chemotaxis protein [Nitratidesulfovibrio vulgaris]ABM27319.1 methyl-accepting chemotaxis sensory transducer [Nitratidesulfovibrio vulgaris DP4]ADP87989.1 methyl-accepting chemotaxis sensory transducer [Nitratidesulfovibrio vulgaris RCH1]WCB46444.1 methyl-accepting chemotaxis protein [Nitratidesulfovibrio vulgaris]GEB80221.1 methyl-accepting chemotaxis protein [Desulfovibrio desulfuricans]
MLKECSIKWKVLGVALVGPLVVAAIMAWQRVGDIREGADEAILEKSRAIVLMAEATRNEMARKLEIGLMKPFDQLPPDKVLDAVPVVTAMRMAGQNAKEAGYEFRVPKVRPRNPANTPTELELKVLKQLEEKNLPELVIYEKDKIRYFRPIRLTSECLYCHGDPAGERDVMGGTKEGWKVGEMHGAFEVISSLEKAHERTAMAQVSVAGWTAGILAVLGVVAWTLLRTGIITPLERIRGFASTVASGKLDARPEGEFYAELGEVKGAIETMVDNLKVKMGEAESHGREAAAEARRAEEALAVARQQEERVSSLLGQMQQVAKQAVGIAQQVSMAAEALAAQVDQVSAGAEQQSARTAETATAMEEMNATVLEVARSSSSSATSADQARNQALQGEKVVTEAVNAIREVHTQAQELQGAMSTLGRQTEDISRIMDVISDIADQTNLLALNAAIEAARAGEAGRGFAVVADEVRKLAEKTMTATKEVGSAIQTIQTGARGNMQGMEKAALAVERATTLAHESGEALKRIVSLSEENSDQVRSIATAAEQQSATSEEINRAVEDVSRIASETADGMTQAASAVTRLAQLARELEGLIEKLEVAGRA